MTKFIKFKMILEPSICYICSKISTVQDSLNKNSKEIKLDSFKKALVENNKEETNETSRNIGVWTCGLTRSLIHLIV